MNLQTRANALVFVFEGISDTQPRSEDLVFDSASLRLASRLSIGSGAVGGLSDAATTLLPKPNGLQQCRAFGIYQI
jgi:4-diphosphocytidyl-2C-methyl-D-erythritol kinase